MMMKMLIVGCGGFVGSAARYWMASLIQRATGQDFPYGTLAVNVLGCLVIGFLMTVFEERFVVNPGLRIFMTIGILGGFTTFSTFSFETVGLLREASYIAASANIVGSLLTCLAATWLGGVIGRCV